MSLSLGSLLKICLGVTLVIGSAASVAWGAHRYALTTPRFAVDQVEIDGARRLSRAEIMDMIGIQPQENIFKVDLALSEQRLSEHPYVQEAKLSRELPATLRVKLKEYEPVAVGLVGGRLYLLSQQGEAFKELTRADPHDLPVITGLSAENLARDRARELERAAAALKLLRLYRSLPLSKVYEAQEVHMAEGGRVALVIGKLEVITLHFGPNPDKRRLLMASRVIGEARRRGRTPALVFLDNQAHPERVVVRVR